MLARAGLRQLSTAQQVQEHNALWAQSHWIHSRLITSHKARPTTASPPAVTAPQQRGGRVKRNAFLKKGRPGGSSRQPQWRSSCKKLGCMTCTCLGKNKHTRSQRAPKQSGARLTVCSLQGSFRRLCGVRDSLNRSFHGRRMRANQGTTVSVPRVPSIVSKCIHRKGSKVDLPI